MEKEFQPKKTSQHFADSGSSPAFFQGRNRVSALILFRKLTAKQNWKHHWGLNYPLGSLSEVLGTVETQDTCFTAFKDHHNMCYGCLAGTKLSKVLSQLILIPALERQPSFSWLRRIGVQGHVQGQTNSK